MLREFLRTFGDVWRRPFGRGVVIGVVNVVGLGTVFYKLVEGWSWIDSFYFTVVTLTTVGYGDLSPSRGVSKLFTVLFILVGVGFILAVLNFMVLETARRMSGHEGPPESR